MTKLGPDYSFDWIIVSKPVLTAAVNDTTFSAFQNIPGKQHARFSALVKNKNIKPLHNLSKPHFSKEVLSKYNYIRKTGQITFYSLCTFNSFEIYCSLASVTARRRSVTFQLHGKLKQFI